MPAHETLVNMIAKSQAISERMNGAFDVTVAPLVELWGFGAKEIVQPPSAAEVTRVASR